MMADPWLKRKTDRTRRLAEHWAYVEKHLPEIVTEPSGIVIDIGPGCGELLEIAREYGHEHIGVDSPDGVGGMGGKYVAACKFRHEQQGLRVEYMDALGWFARNRPTGVLAVNFRGSIEQAMSRYMDGEPHDKHHDCKQLAWRFDNATYCAFRALFRTISDMLRPGGVLMIHANGAKNSHEYDTEVRKVAEEFLDLVHHEPPTVHKWRKQ